MHFWIPAQPVRLLLLLNLALIAVAVGLGLGKTGNPSRYFGEGRFTMAFSCAQLLAVGALAGATFAVRWARRPAGRRWGGWWLWLLIAAGFLFLSADEAFQIHEDLDGKIRKWFGLGLTGWTDRIDDALIALYGLGGLCALWLFRREWFAFRSMRWPLGVGFGCLALSVACDTISNGEELLLHWTGGDLPLTKRLDGWFSVGDGAFTLLAEGFFVAAFWLGWREAKAGQSPEARAFAIR